MSERFGIPDHAPHQFQGMKEFLIRSTMNCVASINGMIARRTAQVVDNLRSQVVQQSERPFMLQPAWDEALQAVCGVSFLAKGWPPIRVVNYLASHPAKPLSRSCGT